MSESNKAAVQQLIEGVWNSKSPEIIDQLYAADCILRNSEGDLTGPSGARELYDTFAGAFPDCHLTIDGDLIAEGETVAIPYTFTGTHQAQLNEIPATGKHVSVQGTAIVRFHNGKIVEERSIWDTASMLEQLGVLPT